MKIITEDKAYVQLNDLQYLMRSNKAIPSSIIESVFGEVFIVTDNNRYEFKEFTKKEEIEFFANLDYSVDYAKLASMSEEEIMAYGMSIAEEKNKFAEKFNAMSEEERKEKYEEAADYAELLDFKMLSVRDILWFKQGHLKMKLPKGLKFSSEEDSKQEKKGLKGLFSKFKKR